ncbi:hypothetical protein HK099_004007 [Clydaea vesicula]|uniref:Ankyrin repeat protein n=1 Tax=Clydaea vesicula TaxID=447962 RepID=A0AAD5Y0J2_9FUNG|nr:hypothetical protein HK099_004007 [Clydaea vesicula]KAJ3396150.1 hypothetical protein HDU92_003822 [Lobulomyces angularis]
MNLFLNGQLFIMFCKYGKVEGVKEFLSLGLNPAVDNQICIKLSSENGQFEVVRLLLKDKRIDPSHAGNFAVNKAIENGHLKVVNLLLENKKVKELYDTKKFCWY